MKQPFVSAVAVLFCCLVVAIVVAFGYSRYKAGEAENAAFQAQLQSGADNSQAALTMHMPAQLPGQNPVTGEASPSPQPSAQ